MNSNQNNRNSSNLNSRRASGLDGGQGSNLRNSNNPSSFSQDINRLQQQQGNISQNNNISGMNNSRYLLFRQDNSDDRNSSRNQNNRSSRYQYITNSNRGGNNFIIENQNINNSPSSHQNQSSSQFSEISNNQLDYSENESSSMLADQEEKDYIFGQENLSSTTENIDFVKCPICMHIYNRPIACGNCLNHFCTFCIREWLNRTPNSCPLCKNFREMRCVPMLKSMLDKLQFNCTNKDNGCDQIIRYEQVIKHEDLCDYKNEVCPILGCGQQIIKKSLNKHVEEECEYVLSTCRWCNSQIKKRLIDDHEETCDNKEVICELCEDMFYFKDQKDHHQKCPELIRECIWCNQKIKQRQIRDHEDCCGERIVRCNGCNYECCLDQHFLHTKTCQDFPVLCKRCLIEMKRKDLNVHSLENCIENIQRHSNQKIFQLENENRELMRQITIQQNEYQKEIIKINNIITKKNHQFQFSQVYKDQDIFVSQKGNVALVREYKKKRRDRFVIIDQLQPLFNQSQTITFKILSRRSEWFAIGICDETNVYSARKYYDIGHLSYLMSANGVLYSSHSSLENWSNKQFKIEQDNVVSVQFICKPIQYDSQNNQSMPSSMNNNNLNINNVSNNMNQNANIQISNAQNNNESNQNSSNNNILNQNNINVDSFMFPQDNRRSNSFQNNQVENSNQSNSSNQDNNRVNEVNQNNNQMNIQLVEMKLKFINHTKNQELSINLDPQLIQNGKFYYCACLRSPGDSVEILPCM